MPVAMRSERQERRARVAEMRVAQKTWPEIAAVFAQDYNVNMRVAFRFAHDWSQQAVADAWTARWPADPKTQKIISAWELWPDNGNAPSLDTLSRLAELYQCHIADLIADHGDHRALDTAHRDHERIGQVLQLGQLQPTVERDTVKFHELIQRLEHTDVNELARLTASMARRFGAEHTRRAILMKVSAALSLAAASPALADDTDEPAIAPSTRDSGDYEGIWLSRYIYPSTGRGKDFVGEHYVVINQTGDRLIGQSLPHTTGSKLRLELSVENAFATGNWRETTSPVGYYRGASYHGTLQMVVEPSGRKMKGAWLGFGRDFTINSGQWELILENESTAKNIQRRYHEKV